MRVGVKYRIALIALLLATAGSGARGQSLSRLTFGPVIGGALGTERAAAPVYGVDPGCGEFTRGKSRALGGSFRIAAPDFFDERFGLTAYITAGYGSSLLTASPPGSQRILLHGEIVDVEREFRLEVSHIAIGLDLLGEYRLGDHLSLGIGPSIGWRFGGTIRQTDNILGPGRTGFEDGERVRVMAEGADRALRPLAFGFVGTAAYGLPAGKGIWLLPGLTFRADLLPSLQGTSGGLSFTGGAGLGVMFGSAPPVVPSSPPPLPGAPPRLTASIDLYGVDQAGVREQVTRIRAYEVLTRHRIPLVPALFFDRDSTSIPNRYMPHEAVDFPEEDESGEPYDRIVETSRDLLRIAASRLREYPNAMLTLVGSVSGDEDPELARRRAEAVRSYLITMLKADSTRLTVMEGKGGFPSLRSGEETEDGRAENRRVELFSEEKGILAPVTTSQIVRNFTPPSIQMEPLYESEVGLLRWSITISHDDNVVARYTSDDTADLNGTDFNWRISQARADSSLAPVVAEFLVVDSTGQMVSARSHLPFVLERRTHVVNPNSAVTHDRERSSFMLVGFGYNSAELNETNAGELEEIVATARGGEIITVTGYTDRIGDGKRNAGLSAERAEGVARALRELLARKGIVPATIETVGAGIDHDQFDNDLPEGRMLSRGVRVVVERAAR